MIIKNDGLTFMCVGFEMCERQPGRTVWWTFEFYSLKLQQEIWIVI